MPTMRTSTYHLPDHEYDALADLASRTGCSQSRLVRVAIARLTEAPVAGVREAAKSLTDFRSAPRNAESRDREAAAA